MTGKHAKVLAAMMRIPTPSNILWDDVESLLVAVGAKRSEGMGSKVAFDLYGFTISFHRPHPEKEAKRYQIRQAIDFLRQAGVIE